MPYWAPGPLSLVHTDHAMKLRAVTHLHQGRVHTVLKGMRIAISSTTETARIIFSFDFDKEKTIPEPPSSKKDSPKQCLIISLPERGHGNPARDSPEGLCGSTSRLTPVLSLQSSIGDLKYFGDLASLGSIQAAPSSTHPNPSQTENALHYASTGATTRSLRLDKIQQTSSPSSLLRPMSKVQPQHAES